jgi:heme A synthase
VLIQGLLGGFRVKLNAMFGADFAALHGAFGQIVLALVVLTTVLACRTDSPDARRMHAESMTRIDRWAMWAAVLVFLQVLAGVTLRHSESSLGFLGPRLHLWLVFPAVIAICVTSWRALHTASPFGIRRLAWLALALVAVQIGLGIESWLLRFNHGIAESALRQVTVTDALVRTAHSVVGYGLFGTCVALASQARAGIASCISVPRSLITEPHHIEGAI